MTARFGEAGRSGTRETEGWRARETSDVRGAAGMRAAGSHRAPTVKSVGARRARTLGIVALAAAACLAPRGLPAAEGDVLLREEFTSLDAWRPLTFPKIARHSTYTIAANAEQAKFWLRAESDRSASGIVWKQDYDVHAFPKLRWRWRVENLYEKGDATKKSGDDYPIRLYVMFPYDPATASAGKRLKYGFAKALYGEYPPDSGLSYVWESRESSEEFVVSPYTGSMMMFLKQKGSGKVGQWVEEGADVLADYRKAFGRDPPRRASLAVMNDSDDTGERAVSFIDWIEIAR